MVLEKMILKFHQCVFTISKLSPFAKRAEVFIWTNLNPIHPRMHGAKFGWNWLSGTGEDDFKILSMYFHYFVIISPWKKGRGPSFEQTRILITQECFVLSLVEIGPVVLEKKIKMWKVYDNNYDDGQQTTFYQKSSLEPSAQVNLKPLSLIHIWRCRRYAVCRSRWSPYH